MEKTIEEVKEYEVFEENEKVDDKVTFEKIQKANETINTTSIKGKEYAEVNQRIKAFRMVYPTGAIITDMVQNENGICIFRADIRNEEGDLIATGTAYEKENSTFINKTSYIENCETSAVGRALGMAGFGIDTSVASAEEVQNAINNQNKGNFTDMPIQEGQKQWLKANLTEDELKRAIVNCGKKKLSDLNFMQAEKIREAKEKQGEVA
jgi:hypothetical protein